ncbi:16S rRNA (uracil(1498)-N(3))-methyltransferase [Tenacibaculum agarivorans]|uniref:16S rRNA (uracil(1498)-N(3))-methyltransferase n=1 Tax=Tenacibaculum agarivorans TaxID=1908389 RepID=UPI00094B926D|nr:16S rRNA (uracil(1498)-N(3))-methyltransferase [Tenacibaculum agarivorans]
MQLFYNPNINNNTKEILFNKEESRHIIKVLRKKIDDTLFITDGKGHLYTSKISVPNEKKCIANVINIEKKEKEWNYRLHVAIAPTKNMDRLEWFIEKATEIGIDEITPILCSNSERKVVKTERLFKIMLSALKQSLKFNAVIINEPITFSQFITKNREGDTFIAHCYDTDKKNFSGISFSDEVTVLIGPEGDFTEKEVKMAVQNDCIPITLGKSRLRTETAGLTAVQFLNFSNQ